MLFITPAERREVDAGYIAHRADMPRTLSTRIAFRETVRPEGAQAGRYGDAIVDLLVVDDIEDALFTRLVVLP